MDLTKPQRITVLEQLAKGYGIEDIAVMRGFPVADVRAYVRDLTNDGVFDRVYALNKTGSAD